jgi:hypothetical protein
VLEQALAIAQDDGVDEQAVLVNQAVLHERPDQCRAPMDLQFVAGLALQLGNLPGHVAPEQSRVVPFHPVQGGGHDVFGRAFSRVAGGSPGSVTCDQYSANSSWVWRPSRNALAAAIQSAVSRSMSWSKYGSCQPPWQRRHSAPVRVSRCSA